ncbi:MAG: D-cysteine desulfhydrase family protein [Armatimonadetes bacterium]|nr:D-cysteine desulfhydrase family protein [Armatimonadota bacterium]MDW8120795.1 D-cysteine desulfhydrase family protein [Armatimonadota bacterium]
MTKTSYWTVEELKNRLQSLPRVSLAPLPTPLEPLPRLSEEWQIRLFVKRDDLTGLAFGGNKVRHLEFSLAQALKEGCDVVINGAAIQSNYCRQTAAACARLGLRCALVLRQDPRVEPLKTEPQGNFLLDQILNADVRLISIDQDLEEAKEAVAQEYRSMGHKPFVLRHPISNVTGGFGYLVCLLEILEQSAQMGFFPDYIFVSSCTATQSGLIVGVKALGLPVKVIGVNPSHRMAPCHSHLAQVSNLVADALQLNLTFTEEDVINTDDFIGDGYGIPSPAGNRALLEVARKEGLLLDPIYTAKAMAALFHMVLTGEVPKGSRVVFIHTGGLPALFAYQPSLIAALAPSAALDR